MITITKNTGFLLSVAGFLVILNFAIIMEIQGVVQIAGLMALCLVPGHLLCLLFGIQVTDWYENFLYSAGLSIIFDLFFGLALNTLLPVFGHAAPLSSTNLRAGYSVIIILLTTLILVTGRVPSITLHPLNLHRRERTFIILSLLFFICLETGIYLVNAGVTNLVVIFSILIIPVILLLYILYPAPRVYPFTIILIGTALMLIAALRSNFILGVDVHEEYYLFLTTLTNSVWVPDPSLLLSAALSISLLPTLFEHFLFLDPQILFKLLYPFLFSITPLIIYTATKRYFSELLALSATCFYMFQRFFHGVSANPRTSVAILFFALAVMVLSNRELSHARKYALLLLFIAGTVFSHYTTSFIFLFLLMLTFVIDTILTKKEDRKENRLVNLPLIVFFMSLIFFWYQQIIQTVFSQGLEYTLFRTNIFSDLLKNDVSSYSPLTPAIVHQPSLLVKLVNYSRLALYALICLGILYAIYYWVRKSRSLSFSLRDRMSPTLVFMGCIAFALLLCAIFAPFLFYGYDTARVLELLFIILPVFLITGVCFLATPAAWEKALPASKKFLQPLNNFIHPHREKIAALILLCLLIPQLLFATYLTNQFDGYQYSVTLNSPRSSAEIDIDDPAKYSYIYDQDASALQWFRNYSDDGTMIYSDAFGNKKITSLVQRRSSLYQQSLLAYTENDTADAYVFLTVVNEYYGQFRDYKGNVTYISSVDHMFGGKNKIFENDAGLFR